MFIFNRHHRKPAVTSTSASASASTGYSPAQTRIISLFQTAVEREISLLPCADQPAHYDALRASLLWARLDNRHKAVTLISLRARYNDYLFASAEIAYSTR